MNATHARLIQLREEFVESRRRLNEIRDLIEAEHPMPNPLHHDQMDEWSVIFDHRWNKHGGPRLRVAAELARFDMLLGWLDVATTAFPDLTHLVELVAAMRDQGRFPANLIPARDQAVERCLNMPSTLIAVMVDRYHEQKGVPNE